MKHSHTFSLTIAVHANSRLPLTCNYTAAKGLRLKYVWTRQDVVVIVHFRAA